MALAAAWFPYCWHALAGTNDGVACKADQKPAGLLLKRRVPAGWLPGSSGAMQPLVARPSSSQAAPWHLALSLKSLQLRSAAPAAVPGCQQLAAVSSSAGSMMPRAWVLVQQLTMPSRLGGIAPGNEIYLSEARSTNSCCSCRCLHLH